VTRYAVLALGLLFGLAEAALWVFAVVALAAAAVRSWNIVVQERRAGPPAAPAA
jgi:hypothetical protein